MYLSEIRSAADLGHNAELRGARVLMTGLSSTAGVDVGRALASLDCRIVIQTSELTPEMTEIVALLSQSAGELKLFTTDLADADRAVSFAQTAAQAFGGFDIVVNLSAVDPLSMAKVQSDADAERLMTASIAPMVHLTRVIANRMRLVLSEGLIVNVVKMPRPATPQAAAVCAMTRATLAAMTRDEARAWSSDGIRINAVGPRAFLDLSAETSGACIENEPELANLVAHLASARGANLSGYIFDAEGISH